MTTYSITDLGILQGRFPVPQAINEAGVVSGYTDYDLAPAAVQRRRDRVMFDQPERPCRR
jgi:hypothetical protein